MNFVCFKLYVYVLPTVPYSVDRIHVFDRFVDEFYPLQHWFRAIRNIFLAPFTFIDSNYQKIF